MQDIDRKMKLPQQSGEYQKNQEAKEEGRDQRLYKPINTRLQKQHLMDKEKITTKSKRGSWKTQLAIETVGRSWSMWKDRESDRAGDTNGHQGAIIDKISRDSQESESSLGTPYKLYKKCPKTLIKKYIETIKSSSKGKEWYQHAGSKQRAVLSRKKRSQNILLSSELFTHWTLRRKYFSQNWQEWCNHAWR